MSIRNADSDVYSNFINDHIRESMLEIEIARKKAEIEDLERQIQEWCVNSINEIKKELEDVRTKS